MDVRKLTIKTPTRLANFVTSLEVSGDWMSQSNIAAIHALLNIKSPEWAIARVYQSNGTYLGCTEQY